TEALPRAAIKDRQVEAIPAGRILANDLMGAYAARVPPLDGYYDVAVHGSPNVFGIMSDHFIGPVNHRTVAHLIVKAPDYQGEAIRLISCATGGGPSPIAQ